MGTCDCCGKLGILFDRYCAGLHLIVCEKCCHNDSEILLAQANKKAPARRPGQVTLE